jgi:uncharacterized protein (AIM24 family)
VATERDIDQAVVRGSELLKQGKLDAAQQAFRAALALDESNPRLLSLLGLAHFRAGQFEQARPIYEQLVEKMPTDAAHRLNLGLVYLKLNDSDRAISSIEASRALDPSQSRTVSHLGLAYARAGRYIEAYRAFLLAGQKELATEIEGYLTAADREGIQRQLEPSPPAAPAPSEPVAPPPAVPRTITPVNPVESPAIARTITPVEAPAIARTITPTESPAIARTITPAESPAIARTITPTESRQPRTAPDASAVPTPPSSDPGSRMTDSQQFVLASRQQSPSAAPLAATDGQSMISLAVAAAAPARHAVAVLDGAPLRAAAPHVAPLSQLATEELVRPDDGTDSLELAPGGALIVRVGERVMARLDGVYVTGGDLTFERATRRSRGHQTDEAFDYGGSPLYVVSGNGHLVVLPGEAQFVAVALDDDILYVREDLVFAFESSLRWENGNVPGLRGRTPVVQFRGDGAVALRTRKPLVRIKLPAQHVVFVDANRLAGWVGRVIPRAVVPPQGGPLGEMCVECSGEGVVLVDPIGDPGQLRPARPSRPPPPPAPTPAPVEASLELDAPSEAEWASESPTRPTDPHRDEF